MFLEMYKRIFALLFLCLGVVVCQEAGCSNFVCTANLHKKLLEMEVRLDAMQKLLDAQNNAQLCCYSDWIQYKESIYYVSPESEQLNWDDANAFCKSKGAMLLIVESQDEHEFIKTQVRIRDAAGTGNYWTAGHDSITESTWVWGEPEIKSISKTFWYPGQPTNYGGNEDCLAYRGQFQYQWNDSPCQTKHQFVCERSTTGSQ